MKQRPKVALVLGGGGALGFAHIGVLDVLQKNNIPIDLIVGTSMGAVVGGAYACGKSPAQLAKDAKEIKLRQLYDVSFSLKGLLSGRNVMKFLKQEIKDIDMSKTKIPFICNAVDVVSCKEVVLKTGSLLKNIRASISVPGIFTPVKIDNMLLVDGGIINNMAHDIARKEGADIVISVDVVSSSILPKKLGGAMSVILQSWLIGQRELQQNKRKYYNILIQPNLGETKQYDFSEESTANVIEQGRVATLEKLDKIKALIDNYRVM